MRFRTINVEMIHLDIEWDNGFNPVFVIFGPQNVDQPLKVRVHLNVWGSEYLAEKLHEVAKKWQERTENLLKTLKR